MQSHGCFGAIIGCDNDQKIQIYREDVGAHQWLLGYVTDGAIFNLNTTNANITADVAYHDLPAVPAGSIMVFIDTSKSNVTSSNFALRKKGAAEEIYEGESYHPFAFVACNEDGVVEGKRASSNAPNFWIVGYAVPTVITAPVVNTKTTTEITYNSATGNGEIQNTGGEDCTVRGICFSSVNNPPTIADDKVEESGAFGYGAFSMSLEGLLPNKIYYLRAYASNPTGGLAYGPVQTINTPPTLSTQAATNVGYSTADLHAELIEPGSVNATRRGFKWGLVSGSLDQDWHQDGSFGAGAFKTTIINLLEKKTYYFQAYIVHPEGTFYGAELSLTTKYHGDIGTAITRRQTDNSDYNSYGLSAGKNLLVQIISRSNTTPRINTYTIDDSGVISEVISSLSITADGTHPLQQSAAVMVWQNMIAVNSYNNTPISRITTVGITDAGVTTQLGQLDFANKSYRAYKFLNVRPGLVALACSETSLGVGIYTFEISEDGLTITAKDNKFDGISWSGAFNSDFIRLSETMWLLTRRHSDSGLVAYTYHIDQATGIITYLNSQLIDSSAPSQLQHSLCLVSPSSATESGIVMIIYNDGTDTKIQTITINADGSFGAVLDTDTTILSGVLGNGIGSCIHLQGTNVFAINRGTDTWEIQTFNVLLGGIIGNSLDRLTFYDVNDPFSPTTLFPMFGKIYVAAGRDNVVSSYLISFDMDTVLFQHKGSVKKKLLAAGAI
jgi:hypothetical protein